AKSSNACGCRCARARHPRSAVSSSSRHGCLRRLSPWARLRLRARHVARSIAGIEATTANSYTVRSTISPQLQRAVEEALQEGLSRYERSTGRVQFRGAEANLSQVIKRIEADKKSGDKRPPWQRALANARPPLYDVHWTPAIVLEKPTGKKGEAWR